jgi:sugar lactone lactonase YvrE
VGPEEITLGPDGMLYTGYEDGRVVRFHPTDTHRVAELFSNTGGRPLGMAFDRAGNLIVADAMRGLLSVNAKGVVRVLVDQLDGERFKFVDDVDIAADGTIWFSDVSQRFNYHSSLYDFLEASMTGRLLSYSPATGKTQVRLDGLFFANGVVLGPNDEFVLVNETAAARVTRLWLKGDKAGQSDTFIDSLPGMPDNISFNGQDTFWLSLVGRREPVVESMADQPWLRKLIASLPYDSLLPSQNPAFVLGLNLKGEVVANLQASEKGYLTSTSANEYDGRLYIGSYLNNSVAVLPLDRAAE